MARGSQEGEIVFRRQLRQVLGQCRHHLADPARPRPDIAAIERDMRAATVSVRDHLRRSAMLARLIGNFSHFAASCSGS